MKFGNVILAGVGLLFLAERAALRAQLPALNAQAAPQNHVLDLDGKGSFVELRRIFLGAPKTPPSKRGSNGAAR